MKRLMNILILLVLIFTAPACGVDAYTVFNQPNTFNGSIEYLTDPQSIGQNIPAFHFAHFTHANKDGYWLWAYYISHEGNDFNDVGLARSKDGINWVKYGEVLRKGKWYDNQQASFPCVAIGPDGLFYMVYEGRSDWEDMNSVCLAVSHDGIHFDKKGPIIVPNNNSYKSRTGRPSPGKFATVDVGSPTIIYDCDKWHIYFHGFNGSKVQMGYASGTDLYNLNVKTEPIIPNSIDSSKAGSGTRGHRSNIVNGFDGYRYMMLETSTFDLRPGEPNRFEGCWWGSELARSKNYEGPWELLQQNNGRNAVILPYPPALGQSEGLWPGMGFEVIEILQQNDKARVYYRIGNGTSMIYMKMQGLTY